MDDYTNLKKKIGKYQKKKGFTLSADGHQFKLDRINNSLICVNNPKTTKDDAKIFGKMISRMKCKW